MAVYLTYTAPRGHALIDRALYLPKSWAQDPKRLAAAGVPADVEFATKPALALRMIGDALDAGAQASWVTGDEVYGNDPALRAGLQERGVGYVLAVSCESGTNRGRLRGLVLPVGVGEAGVPASVVVGEGVVEDPGADLE